jgi:hypothetical protein
MQCRTDAAFLSDVETAGVSGSPQRRRKTAAAAGLAVVGAGSKSPLRGHGGGCKRVGRWIASGEVDWTGTVPSRPHLIIIAPPPTDGPRETSRRMREDAACHLRPRKPDPDLGRVWVVPSTAAIRFLDASQALGHVLVQRDPSRRVTAGWVATLEMA